MWRKVCSGSILFYLCLGYMNIQSTLYSSVLCYFRLTMFWQEQCGQHVGEGVDELHGDQPRHLLL